MLPVRIKGDGGAARDLTRPLSALGSTEDIWLLLLTGHWHIQSGEEIRSREMAPNLGTGPKFEQPTFNCNISWSAPILPIQPQDRAWAIHGNPVGGLMLILRFYGLDCKTWQGARQDAMGQPKSCPAGCIRTLRPGAAQFLPRMGQSFPGCVAHYLPEYLKIVLLPWVFENSIWKPLCRVKCPCPEQGQNLNSELSSAIFVPILPTYINNNIFQKLITIFSNLTEPEDHDQTIHRVPVNRLIVILRFYG